MLSNLIQTYTSRLTFQLSQSIVMRYEKKRSIFDKTSYNPQWIPKVRQYSKNRKPSLSQWTDPEVVLPQYIPPLRSRTNFRYYIKNAIEKEEQEKLQITKEYILEDIRPGDLIDITYQETLQSENTVTYRAFVLSFKRRKAITAALQVLIRMGGMNLKAVYLIHSPKMRSIKLVGKGSGNFRANLRHGWQQTKKADAHRPLIRNNVIKNRDGFLRRRKGKTYSAMQFNEIKSSTSKRIII